MQWGTLDDSNFWRTGAFRVSGGIWPYADSVFLRNSWNLKPINRSNQRSCVFRSQIGHRSEKCLREDPSPGVNYTMRVVSIQNFSETLRIANSMGLQKVQKPDAQYRIAENSLLTRRSRFDKGFSYTDIIEIRRNGTEKTKLSIANRINLDDLLTATSVIGVSVPSFSASSLSTGSCSWRMSA
jgi:hypothetical protein